VKHEINHNLREILLLALPGAPPLNCPKSVQSNTYFRYECWSWNTSSNQRIAHPLSYNLWHDLCAPMRTRRSNSTRPPNRRAVNTRAFQRRPL